MNTKGDILNRLQKAIGQRQERLDIDIAELLIYGYDWDREHLSVSVTFAYSDTKASAEFKFHHVVDDDEKVKQLLYKKSVYNHCIRFIEKANVRTDVEASIMHDSIVFSMSGSLHFLSASDLAKSLAELIAYVVLIENAVSFGMSV